MSLVTPCENCGESAIPMYMINTDKGTLIVCRRCKIVLRQQAEQVREYWQGHLIPEGCEYRFLFTWWRVHRGQQERLANRVRITERV